MMRARKDGDAYEETGMRGAGGSDARSEGAQAQAAFRRARSAAAPYYAARRRRYR